MSKKTPKRKIPVFRINVGPNFDYNRIAYIPEIQQIVIDETVVAIKEGISKNKNSIILFKIGDSMFDVELEKNKWKPSLEHALEFYTEKENYDKCIECRDLIKVL